MNIANIFRAYVLDIWMLFCSIQGRCAVRVAALIITVLRSREVKDKNGLSKAFHTPVSILYL
jgi:hypothetical protein